LEYGNYPTSDEYLLRPSYFNATRRTVSGLVGLVYQKPAVVEDSSPALDEVLKDISARGQMNVDQFGAKVLQEVVHMGRVGILVDVTEVDEQSSITDDRPFVAIYHTEDITNWRYSDKGRDKKLEMVVLREYIQTIDPKDKFKSVCVPQYRVCEIVNGQYQQTIYTKVQDTWSIYGPVIPKRGKDSLDFIPFACVGPTGMNMTIEDSMLLDMADLSIGFYKNSADYEYGLHLVALPTPWIADDGAQKSDAPLRIGPSNVWQLSGSGKAGMLEFGGQGLGAIKVAMDEKKSQMAVQGYRMLEGMIEVRKTATEVFADHVTDHASLRTATQSVEECITLVAKWIDWWMVLPTTLKDPLDSKVNIELNKQFFDMKATPEEVKTQMANYQAGDISFLTFYNGLQTGDWTREDVDADEEKKQIEKEQKEEDAKKAKELAANPPMLPVQPTMGTIPPASNQTPDAKVVALKATK
jgi:hypothetical protein